MVALDAHAALEGDRRHRGRALSLWLVMALLAVSVLSLGWGASRGSALRVAGDWWAGRPVAPVDQVVLLQIRMPRLLTGLPVGASLAVSGAVMQGLFRNPLADPGLLDVSAGAGLGAIRSHRAGARAATFGGGPGRVASGAAGDLWRGLGRDDGAVSDRHATGADLDRDDAARGDRAGRDGGLSGLIVSRATNDLLRDLTFWGMGSLAGARWARLAAAAPIILAELIAAPFQARGLNGLASGEAAAARTNIRVQRVKTTAILTTAAATGASVAVSGSSGSWASWCRICCGWCRGRITAGC
ncbi:iron ABC transporter permease [Paracoccus hibiscisoli]|uniref:Iron ABC transporter permease n=1 Tax=Paracoccus hibiscisoli TaxID=2023261 RepID=A0A4U0QLY7_9RHOB|nr:iron ABC transporter permease [Paracoccus hibiscisoli]